MHVIILVHSAFCGSNFVLPACRTNVANIASTKLSRPGIRNVHISTKLNHVATAFLCGVPFFPALSTHYALKTYG